MSLSTANLQQNFSLWLNRPKPVLSSKEPFGIVSTGSMQCQSDDFRIVNRLRASRQSRRDRVAALATTLKSPLPGPGRAESNLGDRRTAPAAGGALWSAMAKPDENSSQLVEEHSRVLQIGGIEALGEPAVDQRQQCLCFGPPALFAP